MLNQWEIKGRSEKCTQTGHPFAEGEHFFTLLFRERGGVFRREDLCEEAWQKFQADPLAKPPFSFWRHKYEPPAPPPPEALGKETAEELFRRYLQEPEVEARKVCYILALMLERKRILKPKESKEEDGETVLIYERTKTGELFVIIDPRLKLDEIESVQMEVAGLLQPG